MKRKILKPKYKFNPDKEMEYKIIINFWQGNTEWDGKVGLQAATVDVETFQIHKKKEVEIDSKFLPTVVYEDMFLEWKDSFKRKEEN